MKTVSMALLLAGLSIAAVQAQSAVQVETVTISHVKKGEAPSQVMEALKADFPQAIVKNVTMLPRALQGKQWSLTQQGNLSANVQLTCYQVQASGKNGNFSALYNKDGQLVSYHELIRQADLPQPVKATLVGSFAGYTVASGQERIHLKSGKQKIMYRVELAAGKKHKAVVLDPQGTVIRTVPSLRI